MSEMATAPRRRLRPAIVPALVFAALAALLWRGLYGDPSEIPSALIGKEVPGFALPALAGLGVPGFDTASLKTGNVTVVNVWASWCVPCRAEHPLMTELGKRNDIRLFGLNYKDEPENARRFLGTLGQPYAAIGSDRDGRVAIDFGVYGVPETFIVDGAGTIRFKWIGPLTPAAVDGAFSAEIQKAKTPLP
ncbi:MAG: DsbE family thiol:disulfide interchange protein [Hyphomicrobiales bacterium]